MNTRERIIKEGFRLNAIADLLGISPQLLNYKLNTGNFRPDEKATMITKTRIPEHELFPGVQAEPVGQEVGEA